VRRNLDDIISTEGYALEGAEIVVVSYGVSARTSLAAVEEAREEGIKVGLLKLNTIWPFPEEQIRRLSERVKGFVTVEINLGQIHLEVERCARGKVPAILVGHPGGTIIPPERVVEALKEGF
ncbi:MAG: transketolase C-terminal domain-containing protein, partial [Pseudomonadota bacterium]